MSSTRRHIVWFTPSSGGGHARYTQELLSALATHPARDGATFELLSSSDLEPTFREPSLPYRVSAVLPELKHRSRYGSKIAWIVGRLTHYPRRERAFLNWLSERPDVTDVHLQEWTPWLAASMVRKVRAMGKRVFYTAHNVYPHRYPPLLPKAIMHRWLRQACLACDGLFVLTDRLAEQLRDLLGDANLPSIQVVPHGIWHVDPPAGRASLLDRIAKKRLLFFGAIRRNKGLDFLLEAMRELPDHSLTIAGAPLEADFFANEIEPQVKRLRDGGASIDLHARFIDDAELPDLFANHSAIALPYTAEFNAQSGVIFMAIAHDTPVVATCAGGLGEMMAEYPVGAIFNERTSQSFAAAVRALESPEAAATIGDAFASAKLEFSWRTSASRTLDGYRAVQAPQSQAESHSISKHDRTVRTNFAS